MLPLLLYGAVSTISTALSGIPDGFSGRLLEVPVGIGILTMPLYQEMLEAEITCLDYSPEMLEWAKFRGESRILVGRK